MGQFRLKPVRKWLKDSYKQAAGVSIKKNKKKKKKKKKNK